MGHIFASSLIGGDVVHDYQFELLLRTSTGNLYHGFFLVAEDTRSRKVD
jgi:hypothetical protein